MSEVVARGYDEIADRFAAWAAGIPDARPTWARLEAHLPEGVRVLELGCGAGVGDTASLAARYRLTAVDVSPEQLRRAKRNVPGATFLLGDVASVDFDASAFDGVVALFCLNHVPRDLHAALFENVRRWLVPGGLFLATLAAADCPDRVGEWLGTTMFFSGFDAERNVVLLREVGFHVLRNEIAAEHEPEGDVLFQWVLARA
jgi:cyclopropane fatty-acyl-phospholipid synthase-like methyltransferase